MTLKKHFSEADIEAFGPSEKVGVIATVTPDGLPHLSLLTSVMASDPACLIIGEFCKGLSKDHMQSTRKTGFAILTLDKKLWRGKALWRQSRKEGAEYELYNRQPMFRYNTYFGINTVHYLDVVEATPGGTLPIGSVVVSTLVTRLVKGGAARPAGTRVLTHFGEQLFNRLDALKFLSFIDEQGFPTIIPVIQCQAADSGRLVFHPGAYGRELGRLSQGVTVGVFGLTLQMENVYVRGIFNGYSRCRGLKLGILDIDWVYNSMPPNHGQIYPPVPLMRVVDF